MIRYLTAAAILFLPLAASAAQPDEGPPRWAANIARKQHVIMAGIPRPYSAMHDPLPDTSAKLRRGAALFERHCASCHGWNGQEAGRKRSHSFRPRPTWNGWRGPRRRARTRISIGQLPKAGVSSSPTCRRSRVECRGRIFGLSWPTSAPASLVARPSPLSSLRALFRTKNHFPTAPLLWLRLGDGAAAESPPASREIIRHRTPRAQDRELWEHSSIPAFAGEGRRGRSARP